MNFATEENVRFGLSLARKERQAATEADPFNQKVDHAWVAVCEVLEDHLRGMSGTREAVEEMRERIWHVHDEYPEKNSE